MSRDRRVRLVVPIGAWVLALSAVYVGAAAASEDATSCTVCHADPEVFEPEDRIVVETHASSSHAAAGVSCHDCHGGNPDLSLAEDLDAMDEDWDPNPYFGVPGPLDIGAVCTRCHGVSEQANPGPARDPVMAWQASVHARALYELGDLTAPTCAVCHDPHDPKPVAPADEAALCGSCHGRIAELVRSTDKHDLLSDHADFFEEAEFPDIGRTDNACLDCHEDTEPMTAGPTPSVGVCSSCHRAHGVMPPGPTMLSPRPATPCAFCHEPLSAPTEGHGGAVVPDLSAPGYPAMRDRLLSQTGDLAGDARWDRLMDETLALPQHRIVLEDGGTELTEAFATLIDGFGLQKVHLRVGAGEELAQIACGRCHAAEPAVGEATGAETSAVLQATLRDLAVRSAMAERQALTAHRGGVPSAAAKSAVAEAVDAQIRVSVLVHGFDPERPEFVETREEAAAHVEEAILEATSALHELTVRRRGLWFTLVLVAVFAFCLAAIIRAVDRAGSARD